MLKSTNSVFAVAAGDNFDPQHPEDPFDTYLIPQNPSEGGLGLGSYGHPFEWINIKHLFLHADETHAAALSVDHGVINEEDYYYINPSSNTGLGSDDHHFKWVDTDAVFVYADNDHAAQLTAGYDVPNAYLTTPRLKVNEITTNDGSGFTFSEKGIAFIIRKKGNYYEAINGSSGDLAFGGADAKGGVSGTYATPVIKAAINALTPDRDYLQWIKLVGHITLTKDGANDYCIKITELTGLDLTSASLTLENSQNCDMIRIESTGNPQEHCWIKGGIIEGNKTNNTTGDGIKVWNGSHNILEEVTVRNCAGHGIRLTGDAAAWAGLHRVLDCRSYFNGGCGFVTNNQSDDFFLNCISQSNLSYGFWLLYPQQLYRCHSIYNAAGFNIQSHCHLVECYADTNHRHGFYADSAVGTVYQLWFNNCYAYRNSQQTTNTYDGFHIENINDVQFVNCRSKPSITDPDGPNQRYGYYINGCDNVSFSNCMAQYNDNHGFFISNSEYSSVTGCQSRQNKGHGYRLENTVGCAVTGCIGTSNTMNGLSAYICADLSITGGSYNYNSVGTTTYHGVSLNGDSNNCAINGVTARENGGYQIAILAAACDNCVIEGCTTSVSTVGSISNSGTDCIVRNNRGYVTEVSGTVTMLNGNNYIEVPYLLGDTLHRLTAPSGKIHWTFRNVPLTELGDTWVQDVDNDSFTIRVRNAPNVDVSIGWEIRL